MFHKAHFVSDFLQHVQSWRDLGSISIGESRNHLAPFFSSDSYWSYKTLKGLLLLLAIVTKARLVLWAFRERRKACSDIELPTMYHAEWRKGYAFRAHHSFKTYYLQSYWFAIPHWLRNSLEVVELDYTSCFFGFCIHLCLTYTYIYIYACLFIIREVWGFNMAALQAACRIRSRNIAQHLFKDSKPFPRDLRPGNYKKYGLDFEIPSVQTWPLRSVTHAYPIWNFSCYQWIWKSWGTDCKPRKTHIEWVW